MEQKSYVDQKGESFLHSDFRCNYKLWIMAYRSLRSDKCYDRGVRQVTTGMSVLLKQSVHSDVAF